MIKFFSSGEDKIFAVGFQNDLNSSDLPKLEWLFSGAKPAEEKTLTGVFVGPRKEMITPWSTNAVEITQNMGVHGIFRIEEFFSFTIENPPFDPMLQVKYSELGQDLFTIDKKPEEVIYIDDITSYNKQEGLALSNEEIEYLKE